MKITEVRRYHSEIGGFMKDRALETTSLIHLQGAEES
jgi:hypothetical protein